MRRRSHRRHRLDPLSGFRFRADAGASSAGRTLWTTTALVAAPYVKEFEGLTERGWVLVERWKSTIALPTVSRNGCLPSQQRSSRRDPTSSCRGLTQVRWPSAT